MAKREFIKPSDINEVFYRYPIENDITVGLYERMLDITPITEQDIVKPYLTEILEELNRMGGRNLFKDDSEYSRLFDFIDNLLSDQGDTV